MKEKSLNKRIMHWIGLVLVLFGLLFTIAQLAQHDLYKLNDRTLTHDPEKSKGGSCSKDIYLKKTEAEICCNFGYVHKKKCPFQKDHYECVNQYDYYYYKFHNGLNDGEYPDFHSLNDPNDVTGSCFKDGIVAGCRISNPRTGKTYRLTGKYHKLEHVWIANDIKLPDDDVEIGFYSNSEIIQNIGVGVINVNLEKDKLQEFLGAIILSTSLCADKFEEGCFAATNAGEIYQFKVTPREKAKNKYWTATNIKANEDVKVAVKIADSSKEKFLPVIYDLADYVKHSCSIDGVDVDTGCTVTNSKEETYELVKRLTAGEFDYKKKQWIENKSDGNFEIWSAKYTKGGSGKPDVAIVFVDGKEYHYDLDQYLKIKKFKNYS